MAMTVLDGVVFVGLLLISDKEKRPMVFVGMLAVTLITLLAHL